MPNEVDKVARMIWAFRGPTNLRSEISDPKQLRSEIFGGLKISDLRFVGGSKISDLRFLGGIFHVWRTCGGKKSLSGRLGRPGGAPDLIRTKNLRSDALRLEEGGMVRDILKNLKGGGAI